MESKLMKSELLYIEEHLSCQNYMTTIETGFKYLEFDKNTEFEEDTTSKNYLLFFLKGDFTITCKIIFSLVVHMSFLNILIVNVTKSIKQIFFFHNT